MINGTGTGSLLCGYCGRPAFSLVFIGGIGYHLECTRGPGFQPTFWPAPEAAPQWSWPLNPALTEDRVRQIVREELAKTGEQK